jgi:hypothetical protein
VLNKELSWLGLFVVCGVLQGCVGTRREAGPLVTRDRIRDIGVGMSRSDVERILGKPMDVEVEERDHLVLTYTRRPFGARYYPMLWIHLRNDKVSEIYAKRYGLWVIDDDIGIYGRGSEPAFERPEFEQLFQN